MATSRSSPINSVKCLCVLESSALKTEINQKPNLTSEVLNLNVVLYFEPEPTVYTRSKSAAIAICLYNWGDCAR